MNITNTTFNDYSNRFATKMNLKTYTTTSGQEKLLFGMKSTQALGYLFGYKSLFSVNNWLQIFKMATDATNVVASVAEGKMNTRASCYGIMLAFVTIITFSANPPLMAAGAFSYSAYKIDTLVIDLYYGK